ncbi:MAG: hypothetical protein ACLPPV_14060 [Candidatus Korobacteraceae bacterium]|jgi:hypothetical protein
MDDTDRPDLGEQLFEDITVEMHHQDEIYWAELHKLKVMRGVLGQSHPLIGPLLPAPPPPKRPIQLSTILRRYADALFYIEASKYPPHGFPPFNAHFGHYQKSVPMDELC